MNVSVSTYEEVSFLIVDDDEVCIMAIRRALRKMKVVNPVQTAKDGVEALEILRGDGGRSPLRSPFIVLLDINMPRMNGHEFLEEVRRDPRLHRSVIFVLTTSGAQEDIDSAYERNVAGYIIKDEPYGSLVRALELVEHVSKIVVLPDTAPHAEAGPDARVVS